MELYLWTKDLQAMKQFFEEVYVCNKVQGSHYRAPQFHYFELIVIKNTHTPEWLNELSSLMLFQLYGASTRVHKMPDPRYFVSNRLVNKKLRNVGYQKLFAREKYLYLK